MDKAPTFSSPETFQPSKTSLYLPLPTCHSTGRGIFNSAVDCQLGGTERIQNHTSPQ